MKFRKWLFGFLLLCLAWLLLLALPAPRFRRSYSPVLYDREGQLLGALVAEDGQWRFPPSPQVNEKFAAAIILAEDSRFRHHPGVDPLAIGRAIRQNVKAHRVVSGASTITMQTIRLSRPGRRRTLAEKAIEAILAIALELRHSKDEILALYAAAAPFGANVVGLEAASWRWFGRGSQELSWAEAATLAALPNSPGLIHPGRNREALQRRRDSLLQALHSAGYLDADALLLALAEGLPSEPLPLPQLAPHLLAQLALGRSASQTSAVAGQPGAAQPGAVYTGTAAPGAVYTTLDRAIQERATQIMNRWAKRFSENGIMNGACLIIKTQTGEVVGYVGNVASAMAPNVDMVRARRSSGSLFKPFLYAAMLDTGDLLPTALLSDIPTRVGSYSPENNTRTYLGAVPADEALARSLNVPAVRSLRIFGVDRFARLLRTLGLTTLFRPGEDYGLPLILGGAETTLWEITGLYAGLARALSGGEGAFFPPRLSFPGAAAKPSAPLPLPISPGAAWLCLEALCFAVRPGEEAHWQEYASSRRIAWKTGTSFGLRDAWAVGVSPEWTIGVWIGNATGEGRAELRSASTAAPALFELFSALDPGPHGWFTQPAAYLKGQEVCAFSGLPPGPECWAYKTVALPIQAPPHAPCQYCHTLLLTEDGSHQIRYGSDAALAAIHQGWFILPPAEEWFYRRWNLEYKSPPPLANSSTNGVSSPVGIPLALFNPEEGSAVYIPRELDGQDGRILFSAALREPAGILYWHLDGVYLGSTSVFHEMEGRPSPGRHTLTLVDGSGNTLSRSFTVLATSE